MKIKMWFNLRPIRYLNNVTIMTIVVVGIRPMWSAINLIIKTTTLR